MTIALYTLCFITLFSLIIGIAIRLFRSKKYPSLHRVVKMLGVLLSLIAAVLTLMAGSHLEASLAQKKWKKIPGRILSSKVVGERAFRPFIEYEYIVKRDTFKNSTTFKQPGFGGRMNRLDAAEKIAHLFSAGQQIDVYINPDDYQVSTLSPGPTYADFLKLSTAALFFLAGTIILFLTLFEPKRI